MNLKCTTDKYSLLYARWLLKDHLLEYGWYEPGMKVLDLCGGEGALTRQCLRMEADPSTLTLLDLTPRLLYKPEVIQIQGDANHLGDVFSDLHAYHGYFDRIFIRQAAAYLNWDIPTVLWLKKLLAPGGKLVFNTFRKPKWSVKGYKFCGRWYFEGSAYVGRTVFHVQAGQGLGVDVTKFRWHREAWLKNNLERSFNVDIHNRNKSQTWVCIPKGSTLPTAA